MPDPTPDLERVARLSYGRLVALLAARGGSLQEAEDALGDALLRALGTWPRTGVPDSPEAWLLTAARRRWTDGKRGEAVARRHQAHLALLEDERGEDTNASSWMLFAEARRPARQCVQMHGRAGPDDGRAARPWWTCPPLGAPTGSRCGPTGRSWTSL